MRLHATDRGRSMQTIVRACGVLCAALAIWLLLRLVWLLLPHEGAVASAPGVAPAPAPAPAAGPRSIAGWHLFGQTPPRAGGAGAASTLDLILRGTLAGQRPDDGYAVIADAGGERTFRVGEEVRPGVRLAAVHPDRVVLDRGGATETLVLPRDRNLAPAEIVRPTPGGSRSSPAAAVAPPPAVRSAPSEMPQAPADWRRTVEQLRQNPAELLRRVQVVPEFDGGRMTGVRLAASGDAELLSRLGLRPGDVVTAVDGAPVDSFARGQQIVAGLAKARSARVSVLRDGRPTEVTVSLP